MRIAGVVTSVVLGTLLCPALHAANWTVTLDQPVLSGGPGSTLLFTGEIANNTGSDLFLDSLNIAFTTSLPAADYIKDYSDDFLSTLGVIPTSGYSGALFYIQWAGGTPTGTGTGMFDLLAESPANPLTLAVPFTASVVGAVGPVAATPEPGSLLLCLSGGAAGWVTLRRRGVGLCRTGR